MPIADLVISVGILILLISPFALVIYTAFKEKINERAIKN